MYFYPRTGRWYNFIVRRNILTCYLFIIIFLAALAAAWYYFLIDPIKRSIVREQAAIDFLVSKGCKDMDPEGSLKKESTKLSGMQREWDRVLTKWKYKTSFLDQADLLISLSKKHNIDLKSFSYSGKQGGQWYDTCDTNYCFSGSTDGLLTFLKNTQQLPILISYNNFKLDIETISSSEIFAQISFYILK